MVVSRVGDLSLKNREFGCCTWKVRHIVALEESKLVLNGISTIDIELEGELEKDKETIEADSKNIYIIMIHND
jgi:hypothetical protein